MAGVNSKKDKKFWNIGQDWASVVIGFALIILVLIAGNQIQVPAFGGKAGWNNLSGIMSIFNSSSLVFSLISTLVVFGLFSVGIL